MQDFIAIAALLREISFGILLAGLFYTFGMFFLGKLFSVIGDYGHDIDHDMDHDIDHDVDHGEVDHDISHELDHGEIDHDISHELDHGEIDHDISHEIEHDFDHGEVDHDIGHEVDHDIDYDIGHEVEHDFDHHVELDHDVDHDIDHDVDHGAEHEAEHDADHDIGVDHDLETDHSGYFEVERGAPLGVTIGSSLVLFGFLGSVFYYEGVMISFAGKVLIQVGGTIFLVWLMRTILGKVFVESGFNILPKHLVGLEVEAASTIRDDFGEIRVETEMGLRRFHARPFQKGVIFQKGIKLFVVSADEKFVYVDPRKEAVKWVQKQSKIPDESAE